MAWSLSFKGTVFQTHRIQNKLSLRLLGLKRSQLLLNSKRSLQILFQILLSPKVKVSCNYKISVVKWLFIKTCREDLVQTIRRQVDIVTYKLLYFLPDTSLCLFADEFIMKTMTFPAPSDLKNCQAALFLQCKLWVCPTWKHVNSILIWTFSVH